MAIALTESAEPPAQAPELRPEVSGRSPWALAGRRLWRNKIAMAALVLFLLIVAVSFAAPLYANDIAKVNPFANNGTSAYYSLPRSLPLARAIQRATGCSESCLPPPRKRTRTDFLRMARRI